VYQFSRRACLYSEIFYPKVMPKSKGAQHAV